MVQGPGHRPKADGRPGRAFGSPISKLNKSRRKERERKGKGGRDGSSLPSHARLVQVEDEELHVRPVVEQRRRVAAGVVVVEDDGNAPLEGQRASAVGAVGA